MRHTESGLGDVEAVASPTEQVIGRHANVVVADVGVGPDSSARVDAGVRTISTPVVDAGTTSID